MRETIIEQTELLKDLPDSVLIKEMKQPTGNLAPPVFITSELKRRQRFRDEYRRIQASDMRTVAEDVVTAAGVPQEGIMQMAKNMAPNTNMGQNTGVADTMSKQPTMTMSGGGIVKMQPGGMMSGAPTREVVFEGRRYVTDGSGRVFEAARRGSMRRGREVTDPDVISAITGTGPGVASDVGGLASLSENSDTLMPIPSEVSSFDRDQAVSQAGQFMGGQALEELQPDVQAASAVRGNNIRGADTKASQQLAELLGSRQMLPGVDLPGPATTYEIDPSAALTAGAEIEASRAMPDELMVPFNNTQAAPLEEVEKPTSEKEKDPEYYKFIPPNLRGAADAIRGAGSTIASIPEVISSNDAIMDTGSAIANIPEAISSKKAELSQILTDPNLDDKQRAILESKISGLNLISGAGQVLDDAAGDIVGSYQRFVASPAYQFAGLAAAPVDAVAGTNISDAMLGTAYDIKQRGNKNISEGFVPGLAMDAVLGTGPLPKKDTPEELIGELNKQNKDTTVNQAAEVVKDAIGAETLAVASGAQGPQAASQAQQGFTSDNWFQIAALGAMISSGNPEDLQAAAKTFLAMESKKADRKALKEKAEKDRQSREKIAQTAANAQARLLGQRIDKATRDDLYNQFELLGGQTTYQTLLGAVQAGKKLEAAQLQRLTKMQDIVDKLIPSGAGARDVEVQDT